MPTLPTHRRLSWEGNTKKVKNPVHHTNRWKLTSIAKRIKDPLCQVCMTKGIVTPATQADHIIPVNELIALGRDPYDINELQSICTYHHNEKNKQENKRRKGGGEKPFSSTCSRQMCIRDRR